MRPIDSCRVHPRGFVPALVPDRSRCSAPPARSAPAPSICSSVSANAIRSRRCARTGTPGRELGARFAVVGDPAAYDELKAALAGSGIEAGGGESALIEAAERPADWVIGAITGAAGLKPTLAAADRGAIVALANKETLVRARRLVLPR